MGRLMREYWIPALPSSNLISDGPPRRVRLLGDDFVAFRDTVGAVGVLDEACPHRGVSLALGRNEECGLRCLFHGWKLDVTGRVIDTPNEAHIEGFASRLPQVHYPVRESGGIVWVYLGTRQYPPALPNLAFTSLRPDQVFLSMGRVEANWLPIIEAGFDQTHVRVLHQSALRDSYTDQVTMSKTMLDSGRTHFEFDRTSYGGSWRFLDDAEGDAAEIRVGEFVLPWWDLIGLTPDPEQDNAILLSVPIDDRATMLWGIFYNTKHSLEEGQPGRIFASNVQSLETYRTDFPCDRGGNWGQDRAIMDRHWTGIGVGRGGVSIFLEDIALMESIQPGWDRNKQHLGPSDALITRLRHVLLDTLRTHQSGREPASIDFELAGLMPRFSAARVMEVH
jgi:phthalate 4,5-dioxygenase oxygenase subunit